LLNERMSPWLDMEEEYVSDDILFGRDNEPVAREKYIKQSGIQFDEVGAILSDYSGIHLASPDGLNIDSSIVLEIKCTQNGAKHLKRFFHGVDNEYLPQIKNYFAVSDKVKQVHWVSYCPDRPERPIVPIVIDRSEYELFLSPWRDRIVAIENQIEQMYNEFNF
jgi:hypothetical protein